MIYLHIGPHKTGTTTIQAWLAANRNVLSGLGCFYPGKSLNHNHLCGDVRRAAAGGAPALLQKYLSEAEADAGKTPDKIIFSGESLEHLEVPEIRRLRHFLQDAPVTVIVYLRAAWERKPSNFAEHLKLLTYNRKVLRNLTHAPPEALSSHASSLTGEALLARWEQVFGQENLRVRVLHRSLLKGGSLIDDFVEVVGLPARGTFGGYVEVGLQNEMADANTLRVQKQLVDYVAPNVWQRDAGRKIGHLLVNASEHAGWEKRRPGLMTADTIAQWQSALTQSYSAIAQRYGLDQLSRAVFPPADIDVFPKHDFDWGLGDITSEQLLKLAVAMLVTRCRESGPQSDEALPRAGKSRARQWRRSARAIALSSWQKGLLREALRLIEANWQPPLASGDEAGAQVSYYIRAAIAQIKPPPRRERTATHLNQSTAFALLAESLIVAFGGRAAVLRNRERHRIGEEAADRTASFAVAGTTAP